MDENEAVGQEEPREVRGRADLNPATLQCGIQARFSPQAKIQSATEKQAAEPKILLPKSDFIFKLLFGDERNSEILMDFLKSVLRLPDDEYVEVEIADPHLLREFAADKLGILDVKLKTRSKKVIDIEIQVAEVIGLKERVIFYGSKMVSEQIGKSDDYDKIQQTISIIITDFEVVTQSPKYHHRFTLYDSENGVEFTDLVEVHTLELPKLPTEADGTPLYDWVGFIGAEGVEEMAAIADRNPVVRLAMARVMEMSADELTRSRYEAREKMLRDNSIRMRGALEKGLTQGRAEGERNNAIATAKRALSKNMPIDDIIDLTDLTRAEIEGLKG